MDGVALSCRFSQSTRAYPIRFDIQCMTNELDGSAPLFNQSDADSEHKRLQRALRHSEARLRLILESAKDYAIFTTGLDRRITSWSAGTQVMFGNTERLSRKISLVTLSRSAHPDDMEEVFHTLQIYMWSNPMISRAGWKPSTIFDCIGLH
jgi:PAS domain-containing protein